MFHQETKQFAMNQRNRILRASLTAPYQHVLKLFPSHYLLFHKNNATLTMIMGIVNFHFVSFHIAYRHVHTDAFCTRHLRPRIYNQNPHTCTQLHTSAMKLCHWPTLKGKKWEPHHVWSRPFLREDEQVPASLCSYSRLATHYNRKILCARRSLINHNSRCA